MISIYPKANLHSNLHLCCHDNHSLIDPNINQNNNRSKQPAFSVKYRLTSHILFHNVFRKEIGGIIELNISAFFIDCYIYTEKVMECYFHIVEITADRNTTVFKISKEHC